MKKLAVLLLSLAAVAATAQEVDNTNKPVPVYAKTTPNPVVVPEDVTIKPVIKPDAAPRKSTTVTEQNTKAQTGASKQAK